jgi:hypothetical protein
MSQLERNQVSDSDTAESKWEDLYKVSGVAALVAVFIFRRWPAEEFLFFRGFGLIHSGPRALPVRCSTVRQTGCSLAEYVRIENGGVGEWLKPAVLKTVRLERVSGVRIPPPPPVCRGLACEISERDIKPFLQVLLFPAISNSALQSSGRPTARKQSCCKRCTRRARLMCFSLICASSTTPWRALNRNTATKRGSSSDQAWAREPA